MARACQPVAAALLAAALSSCGTAAQLPSASPSPAGCRPAVEITSTDSTVVPEGSPSHYSVAGAPTGIIKTDAQTLWFSDTGGGHVSRMTTAGELRQWDLHGGSPGYLTATPDGTIWVPLEDRGSLVRINPSGRVSECLLPSRTSSPYGAVLGPDGNLWVVEFNGARIARIAPNGTIREFSLPGDVGSPGYITVGPDRAMWFTEARGGKIGRITAAGRITMFALPDPGSTESGIVSGPDGALWFTDFSDGKIGRVTTSGQVTEFPLPAGSNSSPNGITVGPDHALWFAESGANKIGRITVDGQISPRASTGLFPDQLVFTGDGSLWVTEFTSGDLIRISNP